MACAVGDFRRDVEDPESEVSEDERDGEGDSALGIVSLKEKRGGTI